MKMIKVGSRQMQRERNMRRGLTMLNLIVFAVFVPAFSIAQTVKPASSSHAESCGLTSVSAHDDAQTLRQRFKNPPKTCRPMIRWWWPGGDVNDTELVREVSVLDDAGFGGVELQAFRFGLGHQLPTDEERRVDDYLTPSFYEHVDRTVHELKKRGMWIDLTFGSGWPFGGGLNITPELASMELMMSRQTVHGPTTFHQKLILPTPPQKTGTFVRNVIGGAQPMPLGWEERLKNRTKLVAVIASRGTSPTIGSAPETLITGSKEAIMRPGILDPKTTQILTADVQPDGTLDWHVPQGDWELLTFAESPSDLWVLGGVGAYPQLVLDHMKLAAMQSHIQRVGESAKAYVGSYFGDGIRAIFCDSLEVRAYIYWTDSFLTDFKRLRGYDLTPYLAFIRQPGFADPYSKNVGPPEYDAANIGDRVRRDYWQTVSDLMDDNFYLPFDRWAHQNHLLARVQAHGAPADIFKIYGQADIPETEQLFAGGHDDFLHMASSASHVYGRPITSSESFAVAGNPYGTTPERIKVWSDGLFAAGVNEIIYHGYPYMDAANSDWYPFVSPLAFSSDLSERTPFWSSLKPLNRYLTRVQYLAQSGTNVAQVAIYRSELSYPAWPKPNPEIDERLVASGYNFDQFNSAAILESKVEGKMLVAPSGSKYDALFIVNEHRISLPVAVQIAKFRLQGLRVIFVGSVPDAEIGLKDWRKNSSAIRRLFQSISSVANPELGVSELRQNIRPDISYETGSGFAPFFHRVIGDKNVFFLRNADPELKTVTAVFHVQGSPQVWDPWTGKITPYEGFKPSVGGVHMKVDLPAYSSRVIVFDPADRHGSHPAARSVNAPTSVKIGTQGWQLRAGAIKLQLPQLKDWLGIQPLIAYSGTAKYETQFTVEASWLKSAGCVSLDLGSVHDVAVVTINGKQVSQVFMRPYVLDVTSFLQDGTNRLQVLVTNAETNHLLANGVDLSNPNGPKPEPEVSGLLGPVQLIATSCETASEM